MKIEKRTDRGGREVLVVKDRCTLPELPDCVHGHVGEIPDGFYLQKMRVEGRENGQKVNLMIVLRAYPTNERSSGTDSATAQTTRGPGVVVSE